MDKKILIAAPRGWCAGVDRAVEIVELALERYGPPIYVRKQIVHNLHVVRKLEAA
jgi:4-hydroxy-3-methylbut-2-enyl diphosphate reductase